MCRNALRREGDTLVLTLTRGQETRIDITDWSVVAQYRWHASRNKHGLWYARTNTREEGQRQRTLSLHRLLLGEPPGLDVDHWDGDSLNNRRKNLRAVTHQQNMQNQGAAHRNNQTGVRGVQVFRDRRGHPYRYRAMVNIGGGTVLSKVFPLTPEGLVAAGDHALNLRLEHFTHSDGR